MTPMYNMGYKYAPIVMFVYNRASYFMKTVDALAKCPEAEESELYIFADGPKNESDAVKVAQVRRAVRKEMAKRRFADIKLIERKSNIGLAANVIDGVTDVINKYGRTIVIEDDALASPHLLKFMNAALDYYEDIDHIGSIAGYTPAIEFPDNYKKDVFTAYRSCSFSWATWKENWENVDWELNHIKEFYNSPALIKKLNANGSDRFTRLVRQAKGIGSSWSVRFAADLVRNGKLTIYPRYSYVINIGVDADQIHNSIEDSDMNEIDLNRAIENFELEDPEINNDIQKALKKHYSGGGASDFKNLANTLRFAATNY